MLIRNQFIFNICNLSVTKVCDFDNKHFFHFYFGLSEDTLSQDISYLPINTLYSSPHLSTLLTCHNICCAYQHFNITSARCLKPCSVLPSLKNHAENMLLTALKIKLVALNVVFQRPYMSIKKDQTCSQTGRHLDSNLPSCILLL